jgi:hypothetical protein
VVPESIGRTTVVYDVVIPYRETTSGELDYCIRSIQKNFPHNQIHVIGSRKIGTIHERHKWVNRPSPYLETESKTIQACENLVTTEYFWLFNDDFFVMEPVDQSKVFHRELLTETISRRQHGDIYTRALKNTLLWLKRHGIREPVSYELHVPMLFNTKKRIEYNEMLRTELKYRDILMRTVYGNMEKMGGEYMQDVKNPPDFIDMPYISTSDVTFRQEPIGKYIREKLK